ncbi:MAG: hypothetical protein LUK37_26855, partial [Clostridia bacterium]|nr:hypothetical protein [Clostridia bacterium]
METGPIRVAVMADTHGVLRPEVERILETCDVIVHAGDFDNQTRLSKLAPYSLGTYFIYYLVKRLEIRLFLLHKYFSKNFICVIIMV